MLLKQRKAKSKTKLTKQEDFINLLVWFYNLIFNYYGKNYRKNKKRRIYRPSFNNNFRISFVGISIVRSPSPSIPTSIPNFSSLSNISTS